MTNDYTVDVLIKLGLDEAKAKDASRLLRDQKAGFGEAGKAAEETAKAYAKAAESAMKLREVGAQLAIVGGAMLAPFLVAAQSYEQRYKGLEKTANDYAAAQQRSADANARLGRSAASALLPVMNDIAKLQEKAARFVEEHPDLVRFAIGAGAALASGGAFLAAVGQAGAIVARLNQLAAGGGVGGTVLKAGVGVAAVAGGTQLGLTIVNELTKQGFFEAFGRGKNEVVQFSDIMKTLREIIGGGLLIAAKAVSDAFLSLQRVEGILEGAWMLAKNGIEDFIDKVRIGFQKFIIGIEDLADKIGTEFGKMVLKIVALIPGQGSKAVDAANMDTEYSKRWQGRMDRTFALDDEYKKNQADRQQRAADLGKNLAGRDQSTVSANAGFMTDLVGRVKQFAESGTLGTAVDTIFKAIKDKASEFAGDNGGKGAGTGGGGPSPEAVRAFADYQKSIVASEKNYTKERASLAKTYQFEEKKAREDHQIALKQLQKEQQKAESQLEIKYHADRAKALKDFQDNEASIERKAELDRVARFQQHNLRLLELTEARDVAGFIEAQRQFNLQEDQTKKAEANDKADRQHKFDEDNRERENQYRQELAELQQQGKDKEQELQAQFDREEQVRRQNYDEQLSQLQEKHQEELATMKTAFAAQLAELDGNLAGLSDIRTRYYQEESQQLQAWVDSNKDTLRQLYATSLGTIATDDTQRAPSSFVTEDTRSRVMEDRLMRSGRSFAGGLDYVPSDNYMALLHRGEKVVPASQAASGRGSVVLNFSPQVVVGDIATKRDIDSKLDRQARDLVQMFEGATAGGTL